MDRREGAPAAPSRAITIIRRLNRPIWLRSGLAIVLEVPGRRSGRQMQVTLALWEIEGGWYLMSQYGETDWVRNLRSAGRGAISYKGRTENFSAIEVDGDERDRVIAKFISKSPKPFRRDFDQRPSAADHPTFRLEPSR